MAIPVIFKKGNRENLPAMPVAGTVYLTEDSGELFFDDIKNIRNQIRDTNCAYYLIESSIEMEV